MRSRSIAHVLSFASLAAISALGCLERPIAQQDTHPVASVLEPLKLRGVERIDLLLAIDNSGSMGDKQEILARAVPDLVKRLANPRCVDGGGVPVAEQPAAPNDPCPAGAEREFLAVPDIHIGIVSSSLGGPSGMTCGTSADDNDKGHLISRDAAGAAIPTYQKHGFLAWDPGKKLDPPGESVLDAGTTGLVPSFQDMVRGVGETGCGFEAQMESWYRFLIDPQPYDKVVRQGSKLSPSGVDGTILEQRKAFLRPDSLVAIVMLTDENDCSIALGPGAVNMYSDATMVRPRPECADDPNDPCCAPCDEAPAECAPKAECKDADGNWARLSKADDPVNLRCFDQKRRFGKSYLYPTSRYARGLTDPKVPDQKGNLVPNPLFVDLDPDDDVRGQRAPGLVFLAGIVGVPWQDIARDPTTLVKGLKTAKELAIRDSGVSTWDIILGDPDKRVLPLDPHMHEKIEERSGQNPITGAQIAPSTAGLMADPISGHEKPADDSPQYACIFPLLSPFDCTGATCDCNSPEGNPLCQDPSGAYGSTQYYAKAYPGVRELSVLKAIGDQAIVASVCPANMDDAAEKDATTANDAPDFGYRPAIGALVDQLKGKLGHQCLPRKLTPNDEGQVRCLVVEARKTDACSCAGADGRQPMSQDHMPAIADARSKGVVAETSNCFCEVPQLTGDELEACQNEKADPLVVGGQQVDGFCYIDATSTPPVGNTDLVPDSCVGTERRLIRLVGNAKARPGSELFIMCSESAL
jgi:hypothetical protein